MIRSVCQDGDSIQLKDLSRRDKSGPLIVEEYDSTTVVPPHCKASLDAWGNIVICIIR